MLRSFIKDMLTVLRINRILQHWGSECLKQEEGTILWDVICSPAGHWWAAKGIQVYSSFAINFTTLQVCHETGFNIEGVFQQGIVEIKGKVDGPIHIVVCTAFWGGGERVENMMTLRQLLEQTVYECVPLCFLSLWWVAYCHGIY